MIEIFDDDGGGTIDFQEFVGGLRPSAVEKDERRSYDVSQASFPSYRAFIDERGTLPQKVAFKVYDIDRGGYISNGERFFVLKMMVGNNLKDTQLQQIVDKTVMEADKDGDGRWNFGEFTQMVAKTDTVKQMTLEDLF
ncbi:hypothetical protein M407DRAFT_27487 [Tulasnella calospora MUT 4182]|uniref:Calcineurin subunit B n=1 Tax=Tulasnella calospora MUT 4182 TaxID=1051891 RepID=A0A0C3LNM1_9AGAM|nr:hypothetical protein M407DRAFT_27487 [Tulasnella calospora MUT 4182]